MSNLVLDSLEIKNFRAFKHLRIEKLGRVNLIVGKNNVGKSSVLEALWLYSVNGNPATIWSLLGARDEGLWAVGGQATTLNERLNAIRHLFYGRHDAGHHSGPVQVGTIHPTTKVLTIDLARSGTMLRRNDKNIWQMFPPETQGTINQFTHFFVSD
ncbi:MAG: AAA family ATPase, partial [Janthinobacterium lividum]